MFDDPKNELLSAYIDGELTAGEQARVERLLATDSEAHQLVGELRALSSTLQSLPACELGEDLSQRVLRRAEREMLAQPAGPLPGFHQVDPSMPRKTSLWRRVLRPRNFTWSVAAVAVAVLLMVSQQQEDTPSGELARSPAVPVVETLAEGPSPELIAQDEPNVAKQPARRLTVRSLVVCCDVSEQDAGRNVLVEVLEEQKIAWQETAADDAGQDIVEIEVAAGQIQAILAALKSKPEAFLGVMLERTAGTAVPRAPAGARAVLRPSTPKPQTVPSAGPGGQVAEIKVPTDIRAGVADRPADVQQPKYRLRFILRAVESSQDATAASSADSAQSDYSPNASDDQ